MATEMKFEYSKPILPLLLKLRKIVNAENGSISGNEFTGSFSVKSVIGVFKGEYRIVNNCIEINLYKKPFLISNSKIQEEVKKYLLNN
jgi:hypothetical protein